MTSSCIANFKGNYQTHLKHLKLKGLQPKTIEAYSRAIRRIGEYFDYQIDDLVRQAKLGASCRVQVPVGRGIGRISRKG